MQENFATMELNRRKAALTPVLITAASEGLVDQKQIEALSTYLLSRGVDVQAESFGAGQEDGLDTPLAAQPSPAVEESEMPRFIRGFHDILISIGIIAGLIGLLGIGSAFAVVPGVIVLAEIFVKRQRLALPAFVLTGFFSASVFVATIPIVDEIYTGMRDIWEPYAVFFVVLALALSAFYWRYRVPVAFAALMVSGIATIVLTIHAIILRLSGKDNLVFDYPSVWSLLLGSFAVLVFGFALRLDLADPLRITRRSDAAFWMHLVAAPALLYTMISLIFLNSASNWFNTDMGITQAGSIIASVIMLMLVGIILDRRAFVTSGLASLGYAFYAVFTKGGFEGIETKTIFFAILMLLGGVVLSLGLGWLPLRRLILSVMPLQAQNRLPPIRR